MEYINLPNCSYIGSGVFYNCDNLTSISLPNCSFIGYSAFYMCDNLSAIYILSTVVPTLSNSNAFGYTPITGISYMGKYGSIYVLSSLVDSFKTATNWSVYADRITAYTGT